MKTNYSFAAFIVFINVTPLLAEVQLNTENCSNYEVYLIKANLEEARLGGQKILNEIIIRNDEAKDYSESIKRQIRTTKKILVCALEELQSPSYVCKEYDEKVYNAGWTLPFRGAKVRLRSIEAGGVISLGQTLLHEATHHCKTTDAAYFGNTHAKDDDLKDDMLKGDAPRNVGIIGWSRIADSYSYWMKNGFCIPSIDC